MLKEKYDVVKLLDHQEKKRRIHKLPPDFSKKIPKKNLPSKFKKAMITNSKKILSLS